MAGGKTGKRTTRAKRAESAAARWFFDHSLDMFAVVNREAKRGHAAAVKAATAEPAAYLGLKA
jgi:hypothetical protein